jgi:hypothetical protein
MTTNLKRTHKPGPYALLEIREAAELWAKTVRDRWMHDPGDDLVMGQWAELVYELQQEAVKYLYDNNEDLRKLGDVIVEFMVCLMGEVRDWKEYKMLEQAGKKPRRKEKPDPTDRPELPFGMPRGYDDTPEDFDYRYTVNPREREEDDYVPEDDME